MCIGDGSVSNMGELSEIFSMDGTAGMFSEFICNSAEPLTGGYRAFYWPLCSGLMDIPIMP